MGNIISTKSKQVLTKSFSLLKENTRRRLSTTKTNDTDPKMGYLQETIDGVMEFRYVWVVGFLVYVPCRLWFFKMKAAEHEEVILFGKHEKARQRVLNYFGPLDPGSSHDGVIKKTKLCFSKYRLTVTSAEGSKELIATEHGFDKGTVLICHPTKIELTDDDKAWMIENYKLVKTKLPLIHKGPVVLTGCNCNCELTNCNVPEQIKVMSDEEPIFLGCQGKIFRYRLLNLKYSKKLCTDVCTEFSYVAGFIRLLMSLGIVTKLWKLIRSKI